MEKKENPTHDNVGTHLEKPPEETTMKKVRGTILIILFGALLVFGCGCGPKILSPVQDGIVLGDSVRLIVEMFSQPNQYQTVLDGTEIFPDWQETAYERRWIARLDLPFRGPHTLRLEERIGAGGLDREISFRNDLAGSVEVADLHLSHVLNLNEPEDLPWGWTSAIFLFPLARMAGISPEGELYLDYVRRFHQHYMDAGTPPIDLADACPPALSAYALARDYGEPFAMPNVEKVIDYIRTEELNAAGSIDHLGDSLESIFYPSSIWVDSLMMWVLIAMQVGLDTGDQELLDRALPQPGIFAEKLLDPASGLFFHAWNIEDDQLLPLDNVPWLRGNGWVLAALLEMMAVLGPDHPRYEEFAGIFTGLAWSIFPYRQPSGYWDTVIMQPGYAYEESSGSALVAYAFARGARMELLPGAFRDDAKDTFAGIVARMKKHEDGYSMEEISSGTNPSNASWYKVIPRKPDRLYGNGALLLLAGELAGDTF
jgi:unsaturated rhamnogalacturonyl hydrolase